MYSLLTLLLIFSLMLMIATRYWLVVILPLLFCAGAALYQHSWVFLMWGMVGSLAWCFLLTAIQLCDLGGTGWIPPSWYIKLLQKYSK